MNSGWFSEERKLSMTLQHGNRIRQTSGGQVVRELQAAEANEVWVAEPTEDEIRQRAHEIYLARGGAPGVAVLDWLQAERELRAGVGRSAMCAAVPWMQRRKPQGAPTCSSAAI